MNEFEMNPEIKAEWIQELRSNKFKQTHGTLRKRVGEGEYNHCCLGVLGEIAIRHGQARWGLLGLIPAGGDEAYSGVLPDEVAEWAGLKDPRGALPFKFHPKIKANMNVGEACLTHLNDSNVPFEEIADIIERYL